MEALSDYIRRARIEKGLSQGELAALLGLSVQAVSKWENNISQPTADKLIMLIRILDLDFSGKKAEPADTPVPDFMPSIKDIYKIGRGPSSSHGIAMGRACTRFGELYPNVSRYEVVLYGSAAKTGKVQGADSIIEEAFEPTPVTVEYDDVTDVERPLTFDFSAYRGTKLLGSVRVVSVGGGDIIFGDEQPGEKVYGLTAFSDIAAYCNEHDLSLWEYAEENEGAELWAYLQTVWTQMKRTIKHGLKDEGILPGGLEVHKKAKQLWESQYINESTEVKENRKICAYAFSVSEQNASGETVVTSPTCGSAGVLPSVLYYEQQKNHYSDEQMLHALATAGIIGNLIKTNASISGAECGCQAEIGSACAMAAAALAELFELSIDKIEYAAEIALEHHLGLTCDPVCGLVQIPCIERNAVAAMRAINSVNLASLLWNTRKISLDSIIKTMKETGRDLLPIYRETSEGGMAKNYQRN